MPNQSEAVISSSTQSDMGVPEVASETATAVIIPTYEISKRRWRDSLGRLEKMRPRTELEKWDGTFEEWQAHGTALSKAASNHQWEIAEWVALGDRAFRTKAYDMAEALTGYSRATLQQWASVYRGCFIRIKDLSFGHHQVVAALPAELQKRALEYAAANKLSVAELRREIRRAIKQPKQAAIEMRNLPVSFSRDEYLCIRSWAQACGCTESRIVHDIVFEWYRLGGLGLPAHLRQCCDDE